MAKSKLESKIEDRIYEAELEHKDLVRYRQETEIKLAAKAQELDELRYLLKQALHYKCYY